MGGAPSAGWGRQDVHPRRWLAGKQMSSARVRMSVLSAALNAGVHLHPQFSSPGRLVLRATICALSSRSNIVPRCLPCSRLSAPCWGPTSPAALSSIIGLKACPARQKELPHHRQLQRSCLAQAPPHQCLKTWHGPSTTQTSRTSSSLRTTGACSTTATTTRGWVRWCRAGCQAACEGACCQILLFRGGSTVWVRFHLR